MDFDAEFVMGKIIEKTKRNALVIKDNFPYNEIGGKYQYTGLDSWTNGFWPGLLWQVYDICRDESLKKIAQKCEEKLDAQQYSPGARCRLYLAADVRTEL